MIEREIIQSEIKYHSLFEQASDSIMVTDFNGNFIDVNETMCKMFGYSKEELLSMNISALIDAEQLKNQPIRFDKLAEGQHVFSQRDMVTRNGEIIQVQANVKKIAEKRVMAIARDVTELNKVKRQIEISETTFRGAFEHSPIGMAIVSPDGMWLKVNQTFCSMLGYTREEILSLTFRDITNQDDLNLSVDYFNRTLAGEMETYRVEKRYIHKNGTEVWGNLNVSLTRDKNGVPVYFVSQIEDITERKKAAEAIKESEERYRILVENAPEALVVLDAEKGTFVNASESATKLFGLSMEELMKAGPYDLSPEYQPDGNLSNTGLWEKRNEAIAGGKPFFEWTHCNANGDLIPCEVRLVRLPSDKQVLIRGSITDISERKKAEKEKERIRYMLNERIKELTTLYRFSQILQAQNESLEDMMQELVIRLPSGWQYPEIAAARIVLGKQVCKTNNFSESLYSQKAKFRTTDGTEGMIEVVYLEEKPEEQEGPFLAEERNLIDLLAEMFQIFLNRKKDAEILKKSEANLNTILDTTNNAYILLDKDQHIVTYNKSAANFAINELKITEEIGKHVENYFLADRRDRLKDLMKNALSGSSKEISYESIYPQEDGSNHFYQVRLFPIVNHDNMTVMGLMIELSNITESKVYEEKLNRQLELFSEISFINSHELRHEYAKLHSIVEFLKTGEDLSKQENKLLIEESLKAFNNINSSIFKINEKLTFGQYTKIHQSTESNFKIEKILLVDDDPMTNFINERNIGKYFNMKNIYTVDSANSALKHLMENDTKGNYLVLLDTMMKGKDGWDFLDEYSMFEIKSPVVLLSSSISGEDIEKARKYEIVKNFISKPLTEDIAKKLKSLV